MEIHINSSFVKFGMIDPITNLFSLCVIGDIIDRESDLIKLKTEQNKSKKKNKFVTNWPIKYCF